jgi:hypothetical protein
MSDQSFGLWAGTAVNDTSSVVAAGYTFSNAAGNLAVIVKLTRTLMIVPVTLVLAIYTSKKEAGSKKGSYNIVKIFPWFVLGFVVASVINTFVVLPSGMGSFLSQAGKFVIVMAMAAIGLNTNLVKLVKSGSKPILLGFLCWVVLAVTSLGVQRPDSSRVKRIPYERTPTRAAKLSTAHSRSSHASSHKPYGRPLIWCSSIWVNYTPTGTIIQIRIILGNISRDCQMSISYTNLKKR